MTVWTPAARHLKGGSRPFGSCRVPSIGHLRQFVTLKTYTASDKFSGSHAHQQKQSGVTYASFITERCRKCRFVSRRVDLRAIRLKLAGVAASRQTRPADQRRWTRSEEHTAEL